MNSKIFSTSSLPTAHLVQCFLIYLIAPVIAWSSFELPYSERENVKDLFGLSSDEELVLAPELTRQTSDGTVRGLRHFYFGHPVYQSTAEVLELPNKAWLPYSTENLAFGIAWLPQSFDLETGNADSIESCSDYAANHYDFVTNQVAVGKRYVYAYKDPEIPSTLKGPVVVLDKVHVFGRRSHQIPQSRSVYYCHYDATTGRIVTNLDRFQDFHISDK